MAMRCVISRAAWLRDAHAMEGQEISLLGETQIRARDREDLRNPSMRWELAMVDWGLAATTADDPQVLAAVGSRCRPSDSESGELPVLRSR